MSSLVKPKDLVEEAKRRQQEYADQFIKDPRREQQTQLLAATLHKRVHDIATFPDNNGDEVLMIVYIDNAKRDFETGDKAIVQIVLSEPGNTHRVYWDEVLIKQSRYFTLREGRPLVAVLREGSYSY